MASDPTRQQWLILAAGSLVGTALLLTSYVSLVNGAMNPADPSTLPHMAPERFYLFAPFFALWTTVVGFVAEATLFRATAPLQRRVAWFALGVSYSAMWSFYPLAFALPRGMWQLPFAFGLALLLAAAVHAAFGVRPE